MTNIKKQIIYSFGLMCFIVAVAAGTGRAQDFVYTPLDPAFGGSPLNYSWLMNSAKAQNPYQITPSFSFNQNPLQNFQQSLQRRILSQLTQKILQKRFGNINLKQPNNYQFGDFNINIVPAPNGLQININDNSTGKQTTVTIPNF
jgi:curli production assembly/transport component CsgF